MECFEVHSLLAWHVFIAVTLLVLDKNEEGLSQGGLRGPCRLIIFARLLLFPVDHAAHCYVAPKAHDIQQDKMFNEQSTHLDSARLMCFLCSAASPNLISRRAFLRALVAWVAMTTLSSRACISSGVFFCKRFLAVGSVS
jgi:hypothetical protein